MSGSIYSVALRAKNPVELPKFWQYFKKYFEISREAFTWHRINVWFMLTRLKSHMNQNKDKVLQTKSWLSMTRTGTFTRDGLWVQSTLAGFTGSVDNVQGPSTRVLNPHYPWTRAINTSSAYGPRVKRTRARTGTFIYKTNSVIRRHLEGNFIC